MYLRGRSPVSRKRKASSSWIPHQSIPAIAELPFNGRYIAPYERDAGASGDCPVNTIYGAPRKRK
jgi:hypothetical protein